MSEWFSDTQNPPMVGAGSPNISNIRYTERSIFVSIENTFILSIHELSRLVSMQNIQRKNNGKHFLGPFLGAHTNKTVTDSTLKPFSDCILSWSFTSGPAVSLICTNKQIGNGKSFF